MLIFLCEKLKNLGVANAVLHVIQTDGVQDELGRLFVVDKSLRDDIGVEDTVPTAGGGEKKEVINIKTEEGVGI